VRPRPTNHPLRSTDTGTGWLLAALVLVAGPLGPMSWLAGTRPGSVAGRQCAGPLSEDPDPLGQADPFEDAPADGQEAQFVHESGVGLLDLDQLGI
jgi:hypothetical protein